MAPPSGGAAMVLRSFGAARASLILLGGLDNGSTAPECAQQKGEGKKCCAAQPRARLLAAGFPKIDRSFSFEGARAAPYQTNLNALGELEMCYDVYISRQSPFFSVTQSYNSQNSGRCTPALRSKRRQLSTLRFPRHSEAAQRVRLVTGAQSAPVIKKM